MATFQLKKSTYKIKPPQDGAAVITNDSTLASTYQQDISDIPAISNRWNSVNLMNLAQAVLAETVGSLNAAAPLLWAKIVSLNGPTNKYGDTNEDGSISSADGIQFIKYAAGAALTAGHSSQRIGDLVKLLENSYDDIEKEFTVSGTTYPIYESRPVPVETGMFMEDHHYIVLDANDKIDRLKLIKYTKSPAFNVPYWFDAGTGAELTGLDTLTGTVTKAADSSQIVGSGTGFSRDLEVGDLFTVSATATFDGASAVGSNQITVTGHGYSTGDTTVYSDGGGTTVVGLASGTTYYIIRVDANTVKLALTPELAAAGTAITLADGSGAAHTLSFDFGARVSYIESDTVMYLDSSKGNIFSARAYKTSNYRFDHAKDCILARCFHEAIIFPAKQAVSSSTSLYIDYAGIVDDLVGTTLSFSGVSGTPTVVSMSDESATRGLGTGTHLITMSSTQSISDEAEVTFTRFVTEPFTVLDSGDSLEDDDTPKLSGDLNVNGKDIVGDLIELKSETGGEEYIVCTLNGAVDLYHNDVKVLETTAAGITVTNTVTGNLTGDVTGDLTGNAATATTSLKIDDADGDTSITTVEGYLSGSGDAITFEVDGDPVMYLSNLGDDDDGPLLNFVNNDGTVVADDILGHIVFSGTDSGVSNYGAQIKAVATSAHGGPYSSTKLELYTRNGSSNILGMYLNYNGELWAPVVYGNGIAYGSRDVYITSSGEMGYLSSIRESKANIQSLSNIDWLYNLSPVSFNYREYEKIDQTSEVDGKTETKTVKNYLDTYSSEIEYGLIAEDVALVNADFCEYDVDSEGNKTLVGVGYRKLITPMLQALKDQKKLIEDLTARIEALEGK